MLRIIPAIDLIDGKCVRLSQGDYQRKVEYNHDPLDMALQFEDAGLQYLHLVDLDGARAGRIINYKIIEKICTKTSLILDCGGGLKSLEDVRILFECGVTQITLGSIAVTNREVVLQCLATYGSDRIILGADARHRKIATHGWQDTTSIDVADFINEYRAEGIMYSVVTDIAKDGMMQGPAIDLYQDLLSIQGLKLVASGGISSMKDVEDVANIGCDGVIIGKAIYEGAISLQSLYQFQNK